MYLELSATGYITVSNDCGLFYISAKQGAGQVIAGPYGTKYSTGIYPAQVCLLHDQLSCAGFFILPLIWRGRGENYKPSNDTLEYLE